MTDPKWEDPRVVLTRHGCRPQRRFSQNFLVSMPVVESIADAVRPAAGEKIVELGPGTGTLSAALLRRGAEVIGLERDPAMRRLLAAEFGDYPLHVVDGDAAELRLDDPSIAEFIGDEPVAVCGNLPYSISGAIFRRLVAERTRIARAVVMVQREVQQRLAAEPGTKAYGILSVFTSAAFEVEPLFVVKPGSFFPAPKVESAVARLTPLAHPRAPVDDPGFAAVVKAAFGMRRKTLRNALRAIEGAEQAMSSVGIDGSRRGETLSVEEFAELAAALPDQDPSERLGHAR